MTILQLEVYLMSPYVRLCIVAVLLLCLTACAPASAGTPVVQSTVPASVTGTTAPATGPAAPEGTAQPSAICPGENNWKEFVSFSVGVGGDGSDQAIVIGKTDAAEPGLYIEQQEHGQAIVRAEMSTALPEGGHSYAFDLDLVIVDGKGNEVGSQAAQLVFDVCRDGSHLYIDDTSVYLRSPDEDEPPVNDGVQNG